MSAAAHALSPLIAGVDSRRGFFTVQAAGQLFGLPVDAVQTIFRLQAVTPVPLGPDVVAEVRALRDRHESTHVIGSIDLVQTLLAERLFDVLTLWVYPIVLGQGKKVFPEGTRPSGLTLLEPPVAGRAGAVTLRYAPTGADPATGDMTRNDDGA